MNVFQVWTQKKKKPNPLSASSMSVKQKYHRSFKYERTVWMCFKYEHENLLSASSMSVEWQYHRKGARASTEGRVCAYWAAGRQQWMRGQLCQEAAYMLSSISFFYRQEHKGGQHSEFAETVTARPCQDKQLMTIHTSKVQEVGGLWSEIWIFWQSNRFHGDFS